MTTHYLHKDNLTECSYDNYSLECSLKGCLYKPGPARDESCHENFFADHKRSFDFE